MFEHNFSRANSFFLACFAGITCLMGVTAAAYAQTEESNAQPQVQSQEQVEELSTISTDFSLPVTVDSRDQSIDGKNKTSIFIENVVIRQGSLELTADKVEVDASQGSGQEIIIASGKPASYRQRKDDGSWVNASANEIIYKVAAKSLSLDGDALIMQNEVSVTGDLIVFDMTKEQILASSDENSQEAVRTVISPGAFSTEELESNEDSTADDDKKKNGDKEKKTNEDENPL
ncbi:lipopolysaccharide transport periplasmic protein LptA [Ningiella sp. W23]|uniref:lipopolysaccharide transport periplasmic protein LptA n=1 Tax=Ningiella sp. W23 TaxID=3023715 RepID=UPI003757D568